METLINLNLSQRKTKEFIYLFIYLFIEIF